MCFALEFGIAISPLCDLSTLSLHADNATRQLSNTMETFPNLILLIAKLEIYYIYHYLN
jgi:hypothetical protein